MDKPNKISWEAHDHIEEPKSSDWYWILSIIGIGAIILAIFFHDFLFAVIILISIVALFLQSQHPPKIINFEINRKGIRAGELIYTYETLESFYIVDEDGYERDRILVKSRKTFMPILTFPITKEVDQDQVRDYLLDYLNEEALAEPTLYKMSKHLGL